MRPYLIGLAVPVVTLTALFAIAAGSEKFSFSLLSEDPWHSVPGMHPLYAAGTTIGLLGWAVAIGACVMGWVLTRQRFFAVIGAFTGLLWLDDAFLVHEYWSQQVYDGGERLFMIAWPLAFWALVMRYRRSFAAYRPDVALVAVTFFAGSFLFDRHFVTDILGGSFHVLDDISKLLGIYIWATWVVLAVQAAVTEPATEAVEVAS